MRAKYIYKFAGAWAAQILPLPDNLKDMLELDYPHPGMLSPGVPFHIKLKLTPTSDAEVSSHLSLLTTAAPMAVPVHVRKPYADVHIRGHAKLVDFGQHRVGSSTSRTIFLDNIGAAAAQYSISLTHVPSSRGDGLADDASGHRNPCSQSSEDAPPENQHKDDNPVRSNPPRAVEVGNADSASTQIRIPTGVAPAGVATTAAALARTPDSPLPSEAAPGGLEQGGEVRSGSILDGGFVASPSSGWVQGKSSASIKITYAPTCVGTARAVLGVALLSATGVLLETAPRDVELKAQCVDPPVYVDDPLVDFMVGAHWAATTLETSPCAFNSLCPSAVMPFVKYGASPYSPH